MDIDLTDLLKTSRVFSSLDEAASKLLLTKFTQVQLYQNEILFYQGDPSNSVYLMVSGKLCAMLTEVSGDVRTVGYIEPGETVGEVGAMTNEPRSLTVKALKDSVLVRLSNTDFLEVCHQHPSVMFATLHPIITRSRSIEQIMSSERTNKHIVIVPANKSISLEKFATALMSYTLSNPKLLTVSDYQADFDDTVKDVLTVEERIKELSLARKSSSKILYILSSYDTPLARVAFRKAQAIYIAANHDALPAIDSHILEKIQSRRLHLRSDPELILFYSATTLKPKNTSLWLALTEFSLHHHIRFDHAKDFHRLLRFIREKATGLVLSGGGTRAWAHLGVIKAMREAKVPIDIIGGTSAGAVVAAIYAMNQSLIELQDVFAKLVTASAGSVAWHNLTWPVISLFNAKNFTKAQKDVFGNQLIENLWLPFFCVSSNLSKNREDVHRQGMLWEKLRASTSIPGLIPPMLIDNDIHLDGGLLNNLPVDVMREFVGKSGKIVAVELNSFVTQKIKYQFPPILTFKEALFSKLGLGSYKYRFPRFMDIFLRGLFLSSSSKARQNSLAADYFLNLDLNKFRLLNASLKQSDMMIEIGYKEALKQLAKK